MEHLDTLRQAVWRDAVCRIDYQRGDGVHRRYRLEAYALAAKVDVWYLVGRTRRGMRVFRLSRIHHLEVTGERFVRRQDFDLGTFWRRWCHRFESEPVSRYWVTLSLTAEGRRILLELLRRMARAGARPLGREPRTQRGDRGPREQGRCRESAVRGTGAGAGFPPDVAAAPDQGVGRRRAAAPRIMILPVEIRYNSMILKRSRGGRSWIRTSDLCRVKTAL